MIKRSALAILAIASLSVFVSCDKDDTPTQAGKTITIDASAYGSWKYFSFEEDTVVSITDFSTSTSWDIAFHRSDIRVNSGLSGPGDGGSYSMGKVDFNSVTEAPADGYSLNTTISILESYTMPPVYVQTPGDTLVSKWLKIVTDVAPPTYEYSDNIYIIRTANGKYAKIWLKEYFSKDAKSGHVTMKYVFQSNGTRKF
ncbi:MAG: HmuY family protein [Bacteroidales bacterium]|nr:HmuY family protein [Bacteroidales bacterium]MBN2749085.1 HmuY family protein [Bacteroidales bacterium]